MAKKTDDTPIEIPNKVYFRIGDVAKILNVKAYVLRYWESEFSILSPQKSNSGQRVYRRSDVEILLTIKHLLYKERYSIEGAQNRLRELRNEGEYKKFKEENVLPKTETGAKAAFKNEDLKKIEKLTKELNQLTQKPVTELFKY